MEKGAETERQTEEWKEKGKQRKDREIGHADPGQRKDIQRNQAEKWQAVKGQRKGRQVDRAKAGRELAAKVCVSRESEKRDSSGRRTEEGQAETEKAGKEKMDTQRKVKQR